MKLDIEANGQGRENRAGPIARAARRRDFSPKTAKTVHMARDYLEKILPSADATPGVGCLAAPLHGKLGAGAQPRSGTRLAAAQRCTA
jgi:hypothetical protein